MQCSYRQCGHPAGVPRYRVTTLGAPVAFCTRMCLLAFFADQERTEGGDPLVWPSRYPARSDRDQGEDPTQPFRAVALLSRLSGYVFNGMSATPPRVEKAAAVAEERLDVLYLTARARLRAARALALDYAQQPGREAEEQTRPSVEDLIESLAG